MTHRTFQPENEITGGPFEMSAPADAVAERRREWIAAVNDGASERYADVVTDVVWLPPSGGALMSRRAFRAWLEPFFARYDYRFSVESLQVRAFDAWCAEIGRFRSVLSPNGGGEPQEHTGRCFLLWRRGTDGTWRIEPLRRRGRGRRGGRPH